MKESIFVVYKVYSNGKERAFNIFEDEASAIKSVRGIHARYKGHQIKAYYKQYNK